MRNMNAIAIIGCVATLLFMLCGCNYAAVTARKGAGLVCAGYNGSNSRVIKPSQNEDDVSVEEDSDNESNIKTENMMKIKCDKESDVCFAVWHIENDTPVIAMQWPSTPKQIESNEHDLCINNKPDTISKDAKRFCCCTGHMCNVNLTEQENLTPTYINSNIFPIGNPATTSNNETLISALKSERLWIVVLIISIPMISSLLYVILCRLNFSKPEPKVVNVSSPNPKYSADLLNVDNLKLCSMIGQGKYGTVWKGMINEQTVAVKLFPAQQKDFFLNGKYIYCLPTMDSPYFLEYFGCDERRTLEDNIEYLLVLSLAPFGCLQEWLNENTATFEVYIKMARSIAGGLSHLHTSINSGNLIKSCIAHRDFNSRNILVKGDLTCCIFVVGYI